MGKDRAIIVFMDTKHNITVDIEVPLDITATELVIGLNCAYDLGIDTTDIKSCYLKAENPITLLRGNRTLAQYGIHDGSIIYFNE